MKTNNRFNIILFVLTAISLVCLAGCVSTVADSKIPSESQSAAADVLPEEELGENVFVAEVTALETDFGGILVKPTDPALGGELVVHASKLPPLAIGDKVKVEHSGQIALSYPGQVFGAVVTLIS